MKNKFKLFSFLLFFLAPVMVYVPVANATNLYAKVIGVGTYGNGDLYVFFDRTISDCSAANRIDLTSTHPALKAVMATAMLAYTTDSQVQINVSACSGATPQYTMDGTSYFYLIK